MRAGLPPLEDTSFSQALLAAQRSPGGFCGSGSVVDLDATYTIVRAFDMLGQCSRIDLDALDAYVTSLRNDDGGYATERGGLSCAYATYRAAALRIWIAAGRHPANCA
ncbi:hypothetical protein WKW80_33165 [Variovorax humicola]|uniref:Prenyltransferase alpha-alpha toroid domain-containing protein n=1 Tax=Variovorax humicola TaxID=1769758 RepID=A0ABU8W9T5_9BURK